MQVGSHNGCSEWLVMALSFSKAYSITMSTYSHPAMLHCCKECEIDHIMDTGYEPPTHINRPIEECIKKCALG